MQIFEYCKACKARVKPDEKDPNRWAVCLLPDSHRAQRFHVWAADYSLGKQRIREQYDFGVTREKATADVYAKLTDFNRGLIDPSRKSKTPMGDVIDRYFKDYLYKTSRMAPATLAYYQRTLKNLMGAIGIGSITFEMLQELRNKHQTETNESNASINRLFSIVKTILNRAVEWGYIQRNPAQFLKKLKTEPTVPRFLTKEELARLWANLKDQRAKDFATILLHSAIRPTDLKSLTWSQVDMENKVIHITTHKGRAARDYVVPMGAVLFPIFQRRFNETKGLGHVLDTSNLRKLNEAAIKAAKINEGRSKREYFTIYGLKHTYISNLLMSGIPEATVSKLVGVSITTIMKHYAKFTLEHLRSAQAKVNLIPQQQFEVI